MTASHIGHPTLGPQCIYEVSPGCAEMCQYHTYVTQGSLQVCTCVSPGSAGVTSSSTLKCVAVCCKNTLTLCVFPDESNTKFSKRGFILPVENWERISLLFWAYALEGFWVLSHLFKCIPLKALPRWCTGWESACQWRGHRFTPWSRKIPHAMEQLSRRATTTEPVQNNYWSPDT